MQNVRMGSEGESEEKNTFTSMKNVSTSNGIRIAVRLRVMQCNVLSTLLNGHESWTRAIKKKNWNYSRHDSIEEC